MNNKWFGGIVFLLLIISGVFYYVLISKKSYNISPNIDSDISSNKTYVTFVVNVNDYLDEVSSAETLNKLVDIFNKYNVKADFYFTETVLKAHVEKYPELIEKIKNSKNIGIGYHFRPPHPAYDKEIKKVMFNEECRETYKLSYSEMLEILSKFESYELNLSGFSTKTPGIFCPSYNSDKIGGYSYILDVFGKDAIAVGAANTVNSQLRQAELEVLRRKGAKISVPLEHVGNSLEEVVAIRKVGGLLERPSDFGIIFKELFKTLDKQRSSDFISEFNNNLNFTRSTLNRDIYSLVVVHENDFYKKEEWDKPIYRSSAQKADFIRDYEQLVKDISENNDIQTINSQDIVILAGDQ